MLSNYSNNTEPSLQEFKVITGHINSTYVPEICATLEPFYLHPNISIHSSSLLRMVRSNTDVHVFDASLCQMPHEMRPF